MSVDESVLAAELVGRHGVTTMQRLGGLGFSRRCVDGLVAKGRLRRAGNGVLVSTCWPSTLEHRMAIACAVTGGVVAFPTAGQVWELRKSPRVPEIHLWLPNTRCLAVREGIRVHRTADLPSVDIVRRRDGIDVTSPPRSAFDAAAWLAANDLESLIEQGIHRPYFTIPTLWGVAHRLCRKGRPGSGRFVAVLTRRPAWRRPIESDHELRLERAMRERGFPPLTRGHRLELSTGEVIHPDLGLPEYGFFVEVDHLSWHGFRRETAYDRRHSRRGPWAVGAEPHPWSVGSTVTLELLRAEVERLARSTGAASSSFGNLWLPNETKRRGSGWRRCRSRWRPRPCR